MAAEQKSRPAVFTIPADRPFFNTLIAGLVDGSPTDLAAVTILLPSRRAARALREAFLAQSGGTPMLLPRMAALGDIDAEEIDLAGGDVIAGEADLLPAISDTRRLFLLSRLIMAWGRRRDGSAILPAQAAALARDLAKLIDQAHVERLGFGGLQTLVPVELARHWQVTLDFLAIVTEHWPAMLADEGVLDPADRQNRLLDAQRALWRGRPPTHPVIAAGFAGASPAVADLLSLVAVLPQGQVVLPGVDTSADAELWQAVRDDATHPQHALARLIDHLGLAYEDLPVWGGIAGKRPQRLALAREIMRPAAISERWRDLGRDLGHGGGQDLATALQGLARIDCAGPQDEATTIALLLRESLEDPDQTAMLVTPDRGLARRVAAELRRWKIDIDDSAGTPLNRTPPGLFLRLIAEAVLEDMAPVPLLALLKHPLAAGGMAVPEFRALVRRLELAVLRGPRPAPGLEGLRRAVAGKATELVLFVERIVEALEPLTLDQQVQVSLADALAGHIRTAEALAASDVTAGAERLWAGEAGEALALVVTEIHEAARDFPPLAPRDYPMLLETLLAGRVVRPRFGKHARLRIFGTLEARLQQADFVIMAGLNEGSWPGDAGHDPWMSRPMRRDFGLRPLEAQIGLAAHDFAGALLAPRVVLTRSLKSEGAPTVPSRWLLRLDTVLKACGLALPPAPPHAAWARLIDRPTEAPEPCQPPAPCPPVAARPRSLSVTEIETWMRDPYAIYARHVLDLRAIDPIDADPGAAERGTFIHAALDRFIRAYPKALPADPLDKLLAFGRQAFGESLDRPGVWAFWWPRFERIAAWVVEEMARRRGMIAAATEAKGSIELDGPAGTFILRAKADRIDLTPTGELVVIDYKTGRPPSTREIQAGLAPQLPLEALIAEQGGFADVEAAEVVALEFWRLSGGDPAGEVIYAGDAAHPPAVLAGEARAGLMALVAAFDDPATPYLARP
ncbi:MAG TPA: double-strand break repair protein AddB, partial [Stellaceae bacterium]|nr:double-strand break repair protein AddB [Stellaceae bacterium]